MSATKTADAPELPTALDCDTFEDGAPRVLVVDDRKENRFATRQILERIGVVVDEAASGEESLLSVLRANYAVVLMDVQMPGLDGYQTVELLRQHPQTRDVPVIFLTAIHTDDKYIDRGYAVGAVDYLSKPIKPETLVGKVRVFLELAARRHQLQVSLAQLEQLSRHNKLILDYASEGILGVNAEGEIISANPAAERMLKFSSGALTQTSLNTLVGCGEEAAQGTAAETVEALFEAINSKKAFRSTEAAYFRGNGTLLATEYSYAPFISLREDSGGKAVSNEGGVLIFQDIGEKLEARRQLLRLATEDPLTGIPNRTFLTESLQATIKRHERGAAHPAFMLLDLDRFKHINDNYGHDIGDKVLIEASQRLAACLRGNDVVARLGGDEFGITLDGIGQPVHAARIAEKIIDSLARPFLIEGQTLSVGASIGIAVYPNNGRDALGLLKAADIAMYEAKRNGRNAYHFFTAEMQERAIYRSQFERDMTKGLPHEFSCFYQPMVDACSGELTSFEALARWKHLQRGFVPPDEFITIAEETNFIIPLGKHLMHTAFAQAKTWLDAGLLQPHQRVAINISVQQLVRGNLVETLDQTLAETGLPVTNVQIEVTETSLLADPDQAVSILDTLRDKGITIELDDFGTGYSSLSRLSRLPINGLKIDRSFVSNLMESQSDQAIVLATINMAHAMQLDVTAEGVETLEQLEFLRTHGVDRLQGYYFSKPVPGNAAGPLFTTFDHPKPAAEALAERNAEIAVLEAERTT